MTLEEVQAQLKELKAQGYDQIDQVEQWTVNLKNTNAAINNLKKQEAALIKEAAEKPIAPPAE